MRLSEIKGDRVFEVIADIIEPVCNIAEDEEVRHLFIKERVPEGMTAEEFVLKTKVKKALPKLLRDHKADLVAILATLKGVTAQEYMGELSMATLMSDVADMLNDEELVAFFQ